MYSHLTVGGVIGLAALLQTAVALPFPVAAPPTTQTTPQGDEEDFMDMASILIGDVVCWEAIDPSETDHALPVTDRAPATPVDDGLTSDNDEIEVSLFVEDVDCTLVDKSFEIESSPYDYTRAGYTLLATCCNPLVQDACLHATYGCGVRDQF
jgi:hypothetical protein